jgi:nicotinate-nucleotide adenylyltransferase
VRTGIFGGTFDPPHIGHLIAAQDAFQALQLDRLLFVPASEPPHKRSRLLTPAPVRLALLEAALGNDPRFEICRLELDRPGPSYTVDTLRQLNAAASDQELFLLIGADQVRELPTWREPHEIARLARIVLLARAGVESVPQPMVTREIRVTRIDVSATSIRERVAAGRPIRYLVPEAVATLIAQRALYQSPVPNGDAHAGVAS